MYTEEEKKKFIEQATKDGAGLYFPTEEEQERIRRGNMNLFKRKRGIDYTEDDGDLSLEKVMAKLKAIPDPILYNPPQKSRTYTFPGGDKVRVENITEFKYCGDLHKLTTVEKKSVIVKEGWISMEIED